MEMSNTPHESTPARRVTRPREGRMIAGVAVAFADRFSLDVGVVRLILVISALFGGLGLVAYVAAWALLPEEGETVAPAERWFNRSR